MQRQTRRKKKKKKGKSRKVEKRAKKSTLKARVVVPLANLISWCMSVPYPVLKFSRQYRAGCEKKRFSVEQKKERKRERESSQTSSMLGTINWAFENIASETSSCSL